MIAVRAIADPKVAIGARHIANVVLKVATSAGVLMARRRAMAKARAAIGAVAKQVRPQAIVAPVLKEEISAAVRMAHRRRRAMASENASAAGAKVAPAVSVDPAVLRTTVHHPKRATADHVPMVRPMTAHRHVTANRTIAARTTDHPMTARRRVTTTKIKIKAPMPARLSPSRSLRSFDLSLAPGPT
jgi:hypothetical protein